MLVRLVGLEPTVFLLRKSAFETGAYTILLQARPLVDGLGFEPRLPQGQVGLQSTAPNRMRLPSENLTLLVLFQNIACQQRPQHHLRDQQNLAETAGFEPADPGICPGRRISSAVE